MILTKNVLHLFHKHEGWNEPWKVPPLESGITIGWGYDLGQCSRDQFSADWRAEIKPDYHNRLRSVVGFKGAQARGAAHGLRGIIIPRLAGDRVFSRTFDRYAAMTLKVFPGLEKYDPDAQGAVVAITYNRGFKFDRDPKTIMGREGMNEIRDLIARLASCEELGDAVHAMSQNWEGAGADGLHARYFDTAQLIKASDDPPELRGVA